MADIAHANGAMFMVDMAHIAGLVAAGLHQSPIPYADVVTTTTQNTSRSSWRSYPLQQPLSCKET